MINIQKLFGLAQQFVGGDGLAKAKALSQNISSPKSAIEALSRVGNTNDIINNGLKQLDTPMGRRIAGIAGVTDEQLSALKSQIMGLKSSPNKTVESKGDYFDRIEKLKKGLK